MCKGADNVVKYVVAGVIAVVSVPLAIMASGFTAAGIAAGSVAAYW